MARDHTDRDTAPLAEMASPSLPDESNPDLAAAEATLKTLADVFLQNRSLNQSPASPSETSKPLTDELRYRSLVEQIPAVVFMASLDKGIGDAYVSPQIEAALGFSQSEWLEDPIRWYQHIHPDDKSRWSAEAAEMFVSGKPLKSAYRVIAKDGRVVWFQCEAKMIRTPDGQPWAIHGVGFDITDLKNAEQSLMQAQDELVHGAFHDSLTNLPNRAPFMDRLERALVRSKRHKNYRFAVLFVDIDRFKIVNDSLGHSGGDELIIQVSKRIVHCLRLEDVVCRPVLAASPEWNTKDDTLARIGGDEFTVLLDDIRNPSDSVRVAERIQSSFSEPFLISGQEIFTSVSIGIAMNTTYSRAADLVRDADAAMYRAKSRGRARCEVFDKAMHGQAIDRLRLETDLRRAFEREEFLVYYQPIISLKTGTIAGFEALLRWQRPGVGVVAPGEFITVTEEMGLIVPIGEWAFRKSCEQVRRWNMDFPRAEMLTMSVNVSGRQFAQSNLVAQVERILRETGVEAAAVKLEITESVAMGDAERTIKVVKELKKLGVRISIDDFGTGFSSLSHLRRFPIDTLKIDRSFVSDLKMNPENREIIRTIIGLARNLGMDVVAEGTETLDEIGYLKSLGCEFAQGYFFSKPLDSAAAGAFLKSNHRFEREQATAASPVDKVVVG
ncbi:MAG: EAL domain-containing protein [Candidatus Acidiferrales bacterium]